VPRRNPPITVHHLSGAFLSSWITAALLNVCNYNGDSASFSSDLLGNWRHKRPRLSPVRTTSKEQHQHGYNLEQRFHAREFGQRLN